jgi:spore coat polysaccharide biosynthesis protein SpsF (cytidylyltransferase family)
LPLQRRMIAENMCDDVVELNTDHTPHLSMTEKLAGALHQFARALIHEWKESSRPTQREWVTSAVRREPHAPGLRTCSPVDRNSRPSGKSIWRFIAESLFETGNSWERALA